MVIYQRVNKVNNYLNSPSLRGNEREGLAQRAKPSWVTTTTERPGRAIKKALAFLVV